MSKVSVCRVTIAGAFKFFIMTVLIGYQAVSEASYRDTVIGFLMPFTKPNRLEARAFFIKQAGGWIACHNYNPTSHFLSKSHVLSDKPPLTWTVGFNGKVIGTLNFDSFHLYGMKFSEKDGSGMYEKVRALWEKDFRPFVTNLDKVEDPEKWKRSNVDKQLALAAKKAYLENNPYIYECKYDESEETGVYFKTTRKLSLSDLEINARSFQSKDKASLIGVRVIPSVARCGFDVMEGHLHNFVAYHWFHAKTGEKFKELPESHLLNPVDAADLDSDGKSEWIFSHRITNSEFALFWDDFSGKISHSRKGISGCSPSI